MVAERAAKSAARYTRVSNGLIRGTASPLDRLTLQVVPPA
jgi:hypothetical protein